MKLFEEGRDSNEQRYLRAVKHGVLPKCIFPDKKTDCAIAPLTQAVQHASGGSGHLTLISVPLPQAHFVPFHPWAQTNKVESDLECLLCLMLSHRASLTCLLWRQLAPSGNLCHPLSFSLELSCILSRAVCKQREQLCESLREERDTKSVHASSVRVTAAV